jgi:hypothetical protein
MAYLTDRAWDWKSRAHGNVKQKLTAVHLLSVILLFCGGMTIRAAAGAVEIGEFWQQRSQAPEFQHFISICTNGEVFVAAGYSPAINGTQFLSVSRDGKKWTIAKQTGNSFLTGLAYGNGRFVAVGWRGEILTSSNGIEWISPARPTTKDLQSVAWVGARWVACGSEGTLIGSLDGLTWSPISAGLSSNERLNQLSEAGETTLAMGRSGLLLRSNDGGVNWLRVVGAPVADFTCAIKSPLGIVVWTSDRCYLWDGGSNWQQRTFVGGAPSSVIFYAGVKRVRFNGSHYLAFTEGGDIGASVDGLDWFRLQIPPQSGGSADAVPTADGWMIARRDGQVLEAKPGVSWSDAKANVSPVHSLQTVIRHGGQFLAFGSGGSRYSSADGISWSVNSSGGLPSLRRAAASRGDTVVIVGQGDRISVETSTTGSNPSVGAGTDLFGVAASPAAFVAVGKNGRIVRSTNGAAWSTITSGTTGLLTAITWDGTRFHVVGKNGLYLQSADGVTWQQQTLPGAPYLRAIAATSQGLVAVGYRGAIFVSANGATWTNRSVAIPDDFQTVVETDNGILALGKHSVSAWSADGQKWTPGPCLGSGANDISSALFHQGRLIAACGMGSDFETGNSWTSYGSFLCSIYPYTFDFLTAPKARLGSITQRADGRIIAAGDGTIWSSYDGIKWDQRAITNWRLADALTVGEMTVMAGSGGILWTEDGAEWEFGSFALYSDFTTGGSGSLNCLAHGNGRWVVGGRRGMLLVSDNGRVWRKPASYSNSWNDFYRVEYGGGRFVAVGGDKTLLVSVDGETWVAPTLPSSGSFSDVCWTGAEFRIPVYENNQILVSPDGLNWTSRAASVDPATGGFGRQVMIDSRVFLLGQGERIDSTADHLSWLRHSTTVADTDSFAVRQRDVLDLIKTAAGQFIAVGTEGLIMTSGDGKQWTYRNGGMVGNLNSVQWVKDRFFVTGGNGALYSSPDGSTWTKHGTANSKNSLTAVTWNGSIAVTLGYGIALYSTDLWNWNATSIPTDSVIEDVIWAGDRFMAVGRAYKAGVSPDGINWTFASAPMNSAYQIAWNGTFALTGPYRSTDGLNWTPINEGWANRDPIWDGSKFIYSGDTFVGISLDGLTGYRVFDGPLYLRSVIQTPQGYFGLIAQMAHTQVCRSQDGIHWEGFGEPLPDRISGLAWSGRQLMAAGEGGEIFTSSRLDSLPLHLALSGDGYSGENDLTMGGDANGDGIPNALAYYFGLPIDSPAGQADRGRLPALRAAELGGSELVFRLSDEDVPFFLDLAIERSGDLGIWQEVAKRNSNGVWSSPQVSERSTGSYREVTLPTAVTENSGFWRLRVATRP